MFHILINNIISHIKHGKSKCNTHFNFHDEGLDKSVIISLYFIAFKYWLLVFQTTSRHLLTDPVT